MATSSTPNLDRVSEWFARTARMGWTRFALPELSSDRRSPVVRVAQDDSSEGSASRSKVPSGQAASAKSKEMSNNMNAGKSVCVKPENSLECEKKSVQACEKTSVLSNIATAQPSPNEVPSDKVLSIKSKGEGEEFEKRAEESGHAKKESSFVFSQPPPAAKVSPRSIVSSENKEPVEEKHKDVEKTVHTSPKRSFLLNRPPIPAQTNGKVDQVMDVSPLLSIVRDQKSEQLKNFRLINELREKQKRLEAKNADLLDEIAQLRILLGKNQAEVIGQENRLLRLEAGMIGQTKNEEERPVVVNKELIGGTQFESKDPVSVASSISDSSVEVVISMKSAEEEFENFDF